LCVIKKRREWGGPGPRGGAVTPKVKENLICIIGLIEMNVYGQDRLYAVALCLSE